MSNPVFTRSTVFQPRTPAGYPSMPGYRPGMGAGLGDDAMPSLHGDFAASAGEAAANMPPAAQAYAGAGERTMTYDDVLIKTGITFGVLLVAAAGTWMLSAAAPGLGLLLMIGGVLGGLVFGLINAFKRQVSPFLVLAYAVCEGLALGGISKIFESAYDGVVTKAILATAVTFIVMLAAFKTKLIRNSPTLMRVVFIGTLSIAGFYLVNFAISLFAGASAAPGNLTLFGFPLWVIVSLVAVVLAAFSLVTDFDFIDQAVRNGAPVSASWTCAWGLMVTLVWLYLEFLRLLSYFSSND